MKPCFGYIRVSTLKQGEGVSLEAQMDSILAFASRENLSIIKWFEEKQTAAKGGRPVFNQMLTQLRRGSARGVIIHKIDRSARNLRDWAMFSELPDHGIDIYVATETLDFNSRGGRITADIQAVIAADYIRNLREETIKGLSGRLKQGLYPFRAPIGYLDKGKGKPKAPDPQKAPLIRELFDLYASGQHSLRSLQAEMNRRGLRNLAGRPLSLHGVETILNNTFYAGIITIARTGASYEGIHEPLISANQFARVQDAKAGRAAPKVTRHNHLFQGLFRCGLCEGPMCPERQKGRVYYRCQRSSCPTTTVREDRLEDTIRHHLSRLQISLNLAEEMEDTWCKEQANTDTTAKAKAISLQIADEERRLDRLTDLLVDEALDQQTFHDRQRSGKLRLVALREQLAAIPDPAALAKNHGDFLELMKNLCLLYEIGEPTEKRELVENVFSNRKVIGKNVELEPRDWLRRPDLTHGVSFGDPERYGDTDLPAAPAGAKNIEHLISLSKRLTKRRNVHEAD
ncbi:recombinase family protein [Pseudoruegeria sp. HB172150]|uniref:recombinase family protein n=1 Tax=Pseudoruegeria sp. HB172150 TaxID=2721164 RepID=UPI00210FA569|nr:recombinase family protein [Pseudoruegeria sp. HB172150]